MNVETERTARRRVFAGFPLTFKGALALALFFLLAPAPCASAQEGQGSPDESPRRENTRGPAARRRAAPGGGNLLRRLGLSPEQLARLGEVRRESEPEVRALTRRLNQARRALDEAVYGDALDEASVEQRARELAAAQAALSRMRALTEVRVRRILTPEQLQTFRELRQRARLQQRQRRQARRGRRSGARRDPFGLRPGRNPQAPHAEPQNSRPAAADPLRRRP